MKTTAAEKFHRPFFILNPVAGTSDAEKIRAEFEEACARFDWQPQVHMTRAGDDIDQIVSAAIAKGCDVMMAGGGDGTVSQVASALVGKRLPLAIIPTGTANLLARQLLLPLQLEKIFLYLADEPDTIFLDAMQIGERYYVLNASVGFSSALIQNTSREDKRRLGLIAYFWTGLRILIGFQPYRFDMIIDGNRHVVRASEVFISDAYLLKENVLLKNLEIPMEEGHLVVFAIKSRTFRDYLLLIGDVLFGKPRRSYRIRVFQIKNQIEVSTKKPLMAQADGEMIGKTPLVVKVIPEAIQILVPNEQHQLKPLIPMG